MKLIAAVSMLLVSLGTTVAHAQAPRNHGGFVNVVVIFQENRTPDNLFGSNPNFTRGVDIATTGITSDRPVTSLSPVALANDYHMSHAHSDVVAMYDEGK